MRITAIVLAAGLSSRMGSLKQLLPYKKTTVLGAVITSLLQSEVNDIIVVTGFRTDDVEKSISGLPIRIVYNENYQSGMHSSVIKGIESLSDEVDAFLIVLGDQPQLSSKVVKDLIQFKNKTDKAIIIPSYSNKRGHPVLFDKKLADEIKHIEGSIGLKSVINQNENNIEYFIVEDSSVLIDMDTPDDYEKLTNKTL